MAKPLARHSPHTDPSRVWAGLDTDRQRRALQLLAQMALHVLTEHAAPPLKEEESLCSNSAITPRSALTTSPGQR
jgi:hypothetical protein